MLDNDGAGQPDARLMARCVRRKCLGRHGLHRRCPFYFLPHLHPQLDGRNGHEPFPGNSWTASISGSSTAGATGLAHGRPQLDWDGTHGTTDLRGRDLPLPAPPTPVASWASCPNGFRNLPAPGRFGPWRRMDLHVHRHHRDPWHVDLPPGRGHQSSFHPHFRAGPELKVDRAWPTMASVSRSWRYKVTATR